MNYFDATKLLAPGGLAPRTRGPRDGDMDTPHKPALTLPNFNPARAKLAAPSTRIDDAPLVAPARPAAPTPQRKIMPATGLGPNQQRIIDAIDKHGNLKFSELAKLTRLNDKQLKNALFLLQGARLIDKGGNRFDRIYGKPGAKFPPDAAPAKAKATKPAKTPGTTSTVVTPFAARHEDLMPATRADRHHEITEVTALPCRAMKLANGGAIVLQGASLVAELTAAQLDARVRAVLRRGGPDRPDERRPGERCARARGDAGGRVEREAERVRPFKRDEQREGRRVGAGRGSAVERRCGV